MTPPRQGKGSQVSAEDLDPPEAEPPTEAVTPEAAEPAPHASVREEAAPADPEPPAETAEEEHEPVEPAPHELAPVPVEPGPIEPEPEAPPPPPPPLSPPRVEPPREAVVIPFRPAPKPAPARRPGRLRRIISVILILLIAGPPLQVVVLRIVPPLFTELMVQRLIQGYGWDYQWRPLSQMSPALAEAAVASEDARFCSHHGFDFQAMQAAMRHNERRPNGKVKGGSTISQQTAKNVFLWPGRSYVRKGMEAWYTVLIETLWGKRRIMEVYLNVVEFGPGVYGAQAASQHFFHEDASRLSAAQAAHLIAVLPKPLSWRVAAPGAYVAKRSRRIDGAIGTVRDDGLAGCVGR